MASCKDCLSVDVCYKYKDICNGVKLHDEYFGEDGSCVDFKDRNRFIELPCEIGCKVFEVVLYKDKTVSHINTHKVVGVHLGDFPDLRGHKRAEYLVTHCDVMNFLSRIPLNKIGKTVFLTREEAEQALKERT